MQSVLVALGDRGYPIHIGAGLLAQGELLLPHLPQPRVAIVSNATVGPLCIPVLRQTLEGQGIAVVTVILPDGEAHKTLNTLNLILDALIRERCERKTTLIALGGGVIGDLVGFAAAVYLRGVPFIQVPTTLLAQVDSSVGGKTGVNHPLGKNMIGAFYQPRLVLADTATLDSLPDRELCAGIAEVIKYGLIRDPHFFDWLDRNVEQLVARDPSALAYAIQRSCENKAEVVAKDERESGVRALLNLGHTFGHAIEAGLGYGEWLHGEAVAAGTLIAAQLSRRLGLIDDHAFSRIQGVYERAGLPIAAPDLGAARYIELMRSDKKVESGRIQFVLLDSIGHAFVSGNVPDQALREVLSGKAVHA